MAIDNTIKGIDVEEIIAYQPTIRPGYTAWVNLFPGPCGSMLLSFLEIRKEENPHFEPASIEFAESMSSTIKVLSDLLGKSTRDFVFEYPVLSSDNGRDWQEIGRTTEFERHFFVCTLPDGGLVRAHPVNAFRYDLGADRHKALISRSDDNGNSWRVISSVVDDVFFYMHRLRVLRDGTLIVIGCLQPTFGPGGQIPQRVTMPVGVENIATGVFFLSRDGGYTWDHPQIIVPGEQCWEPDFVELPSGDLLFICSTSQASRNTRQYYYKRGTRFIPGPVLLIEADPDFIVPETVVAGDDGLLVGARRWQCVEGSGTYVCSNDEGASWHVIKGLPQCNYQPMIQRLSDGRFICASHIGADTRFGQHDMNITVHIFGLEGAVPAVTSMSIEREMNPARTQYINAYSTTLSSAGKPVAKKVVQVRVLDMVSREDHRDIRHPKDVQTRGKVVTATTDENGVATVSFEEYDKVAEMHIHYFVGAFYEPLPTDGLAPCRSPIYAAYAMTPERNNPNNYGMYLTANVLWVSDELADAYPEITGMVEQFSAKSIDSLTKQDVVERLSVSQERAQEVIDVLCASNVLLAGEGCSYTWNDWRTWVTRDNPLPIDEVKRICVFDYLS